jgi:hypothetical protein
MQVADDGIARRGLLRQGDVLLVPVVGLPDGPYDDEQPREDGALVVAYGEATGHAHVICPPHVRLMQVQGLGRFLVVEGERPAALTHEEHWTIWVDRGVYEVRRQREYAPARRPSWVRD